MDASKTAESQTARVTLEFEVVPGQRPGEWPWGYILSRSDAIKMRPGESVRVVEDDRFLAASSKLIEADQEAALRGFDTTTFQRLWISAIARVLGLDLARTRRSKCDHPVDGSIPSPGGLASPALVEAHQQIATLAEERDAAIRERDRIRENAKADHNIANAACDERDAAIRERDNERLVRIGTETDRDFARREKDAAIFHITELRTERDKLQARVAELEARTSTAGEVSRVAPAANGGGEQQGVSSDALGAPGSSKASVLTRCGQNGRLEAASGGGEAVARLSADSPKCSATVNKTAEPQSGMRTERVTLEVVHGAIASINDQRWWDNRLWIEPQKGESVRVVEEPESTDLRHRWDRDGERCLKCRDKDWMGGPCSTTDDEYIAALTAERDAAIRERQKLEARLSRVLKSSDSMWSQILVVGAERDKLRARVAELEGCSWVPKAELDALQARVAELEAASGGNPPETPVSSTQAASGGGEGEPVAWARRFHECYERLAPQFGYETRKDTRIFDPESQNGKLMCAVMESIVCGAAPPQPRGWLSEEERKHIFLLAVEYETQAKHLEKPGTWGSGLPKPSKLRADAAMLRNLIARSSPPEVVLPVPPFARSNVAYSVWMMCLKAVKESLAAAGVPVKESP